LVFRSILPLSSTPPPPFPSSPLLSYLSTPLSPPTLADKTTDTTVGAVAAHSSSPGIYAPATSTTLVGLATSGQIQEEQAPSDPLPSHPANHVDSHTHTSVTPQVYNIPRARNEVQSTGGMTACHTGSGPAAERIGAPTVNPVVLNSVLSSDSAPQKPSFHFSFGTQDSPVCPSSAKPTASQASPRKSPTKTATELNQNHQKRNRNNHDLNDSLFDQSLLSLDIDDLRPISLAWDPG
jgi:hypothetical protein